MAPATPNSDRSITKTTLQSEKQSPQKNNTIAGQITEAKKKILKLKETRTYTHTILTQKAIAAGNTGLKEADQEATRLAKLMKRSVDKALTTVSAKRLDLIKDGKSLTRNNSQEPYPIQAEYLILTDYQKILTEYLNEVGTGTLKVNLYDQVNGILCPQTVHPWVFLFVKFGEYEKNANKRDWRVIWSTDVIERAESDVKAGSKNSRTTRGTKRSSTSGYKSSNKSTSATVGAVTITSNDVDEYLKLMDSGHTPPDDFINMVKGIRIELRRWARAVAGAPRSKCYRGGVRQRLSLECSHS
jgi:hypothetical protein